MPKRNSSRQGRGRRLCSVLHSHTAAPVPDEYLFAYGTLMRGYELHALLPSAATLVGLAYTRGVVLDLGRYPGLVEGRGVVHGELYRITNRELLRTLDRQEGYNFGRRRARATLAADRSVRAWVYRYRGPTRRGRAIPTGDYRRRRSGTVSA